MKKADAILCGDIHLREQVPVARTDDFEAAQWIKMFFIKGLQKKHGCPVLCSGDLFHHWKASPALLTKAMQHLPDEFYSIYGDHDLPQHNFEMKEKSGLTTLLESGNVELLNGGHGTNKSKTKLPKTIFSSKKIKGRHIFVWHVLTWKKELPFPNCETSNAKKLLKKNPQFDLIVTGDNHIPFTEKHKGRLLVNVGSMMRNNADQIDYLPAVWLYYAKTNTVERVYLPIEENVVSREHIEKEQERNDRIDSFVGALDSEFKVELNFEDNVESFFSQNKTKKVIRNLVNTYLYD